MRTGFGGIPSINPVPAGLQQPRIQQYNATFEHEVMRDTSIRLSYLGSSMSGLIAGVDLNEIPPSDVPFGTRPAAMVTWHVIQLTTEIATIRTRTLRANHFRV